ncbi:MAG: AIPR family protein [Leptospiraceae bacterium]|nr:AIPR family protein [Leptospiraceae bacterium]
MMVSKQDLDGAYKDFKSKLGWSREEYFPLLFLSAELHKDETELFANVNQGKNEIGLNAYYFDKERRNLYLYSFLWSENHKNFKESFQQLIQSGIESIFGETKSKDKFLWQIRSSIHENKSLIDRVFIYFVFNGDPDKAQNSDTLGSLREDLESKKFIIDNFFQKKEVTLTVDFLSNVNKRRGRFSEAKKTFRYELPLENFLARENKDKHRLIVGFIKILDLAKMYEDMGLRLFEKNIRAGLSPENHPNRSIRSSLKSMLAGEEESANFVYHHNGVTIAAEHVEESSGKLVITEPRVLNGAQTITSIAKFIEENTTSKTSIESNKSFKSIEVLAKIILPDSKTNSSDFIVNITINNNRQNPVEPWNLRASDLIQLEFSDKFKDELSVYYERQENAFDSLSADDLEEMKISQSKSIQIKKLAQTFLATQGEIDKINKLRDIFEDEKKYYNIFKKKYLSTDAKKILLLYKIQFRLGSVMRAVSENAQEKYFELYNKSKNLIWCLLIQGVLNDSKIEAHVSMFGKNLLIEADFNELLKNIGVKKIKPLLTELLKDEKYQKNIQEGNYLFLKNKAALDKCLKYAEEKFDWKKLDI